MTYIILNIIFLSIVCAILLVLFAKYLSPISKKNIAYALITVLILTAFFDSLIILSGIVAYNPDNILGVYIWKAPIEDFAYAIASVLLTSLLWEYYEKSKNK